MLQQDALGAGPDGAPGLPVPGARDWLAQARRGVLELCVLVVIGQRPHYGYELGLALSAWRPLAATEGTLYPLLRRLQRDGLIDAFWEESRDGPARKYYRLSPTGAALRDAQLADWDALVSAVHELRVTDATPRNSNDKDKESPHAARA
jgi:PadR family transcriptional regulator, regulatory protein PadR